MEEQLQFQCCFCGRTIEATPPNVASLVYTACFDRPPDMQRDQTLFCHTACLASRLHPSVKLYAADLVEMHTREPKDRVQ